MQRLPGRVLFFSAFQKLNNWIIRARSEQPVNILGSKRHETVTKALKGPLVCLFQTQRQQALTRSTGQSFIAGHSETVNLTEITMNEPPSCLPTSNQLYYMQTHHTTSTFLSFHIVSLPITLMSTTNLFEDMYVKHHLHILHNNSLLVSSKFTNGKQEEFVLSFISHSDDCGSALFAGFKLSYLVSHFWSTFRKRNLSELQSP